MCGSCTHSVIHGASDHPGPKWDVWSAASKDFLKLGVTQPAAFYSLEFFC